MSKWSEISTILGTAIVAQSSSYFRHLFPRLYAQMTDGRIAVLLWSFIGSCLIFFSTHSVSCLRGRIHGGVSLWAYPGSPDW